MDTVAEGGDYDFHHTAKLFDENRNHRLRRFAEITHYNIFTAKRLSRQSRLSLSSFAG